MKKILTILSITLIAVFSLSAQSVINDVVLLNDSSIVLQTVTQIPVTVADLDAKIKETETQIEATKKQIQSLQDTKTELIRLKAILQTKKKQ